jgi:CRP-like cAMP-binding protein
MTPQQPDQAWIQNRLLKVMSPSDFTALRPHLEPIVLTRRMSLIASHKPIEHLYFPETGVASSVAGDPRGEQIEIGLVGREGVTGIPVLLRAEQSPHECFIQIPGNGFRIKADAMLTALEQSPTLNTLMLRYVQAVHVELGCTALAHGSFSLSVRLARWLLMCQDRMGKDELSLVHEFLALMLGVRRAGVTETTHILEGGGSIKATRGLVTIRDREKLLEIADSSYGVPEAEYNRLISPSGEGAANWRSP